MKRIRPSLERGSFSLLCCLCVACGTDSAPSDASPADAGGKADCVGYACDASEGAPVYLEQGWDDADREDFYGGALGAAIMPWAWFSALEEAGSERLFTDPENLGRYNVLAASQDGAPPIGMTRETSPVLGDAVGLTCALCHTQEIEYDGVRMRLEGSTTQTDVFAYLTAIFTALGATLQDDAKFERFADRLGAQDPAALREQVGAYLQARAARPPRTVGTPEGPGRVDTSIGIINALVHAFDPGNNDDLVAPLSISPIWQTADLDFSHNSSSNRQPFARNLAVALGLGAPVNYEEGPDQFTSGANLEGIKTVTDRVAELKAPTWPEEILGEIDIESRDRGQAIYAKNCAGCHDGSAVDGEILQVTVPIDEIGTDPEYAVRSADRTMQMGSLGVGLGVPEGDKVGTGEFLELILDVIGAKTAAANGLDLATLAGERSNDWVFEKVYRARLLYGVWATGPYLHNGSVPNLYQLLLPAAERDISFTLGSTAFDPVNVGFASDDREGAFVLDTTLTGNSNAGHEGPGYGTDLDEKSRLDLLEYLKTL